MKRNLNGRFRIFSLALSRSTLAGVSLIVSVLLIEIAETFGTSIGQASQAMTFYSIVSMLASLVMAFISVRFNPTRLLNVGLGISFLSALGVLFAPSYSVFFVMYGLCGVGSSLIIPMVTTITGEISSGEQRSRNLGVIMAGPAVFYLAGYLVVGLISEWRLALTYFALPLLAISLFASLRMLPRVQSGGEDESMMLGLKSICANRSALCCIFVGAISGVWMVTLNLVATYYREVHGIPIFTVTVLTAAMALTYAFGSIMGGRFIYRMGIKRAVTLCRILMGVTFIVLMGTSNTVIALAMGFVISVVSGVSSPAILGLNLSQVPEYNGSMMSISSASVSLGTAMNMALMGILLTGYGWGYASTAVGVIGIIGGVITHLFVKEPIDN